MGFEVGIGGGMCMLPLKAYMPLLGFGLPKADSEGDGYEGRERVCLKVETAVVSGRLLVLALSPH